MPLPPTRYIDAGPGVPLANPNVAMAQGEAMARMGETISAIGEKGFQIAERVRNIEEGGKIADFMRKNDEQSATFSDGLMRRSDTAAWRSDWTSQTSTMREEVRNLGLSPEGRARAEMELADWTSKRTIHFESLANSKAVEMGRMQMTNAATHHFKRGDVDKGKQTLQEGAQLGLFDPAELEEGLRRGDEIAAETELGTEIDHDPKGTLARLESGEFLKFNPGADLQLVERGKRQALAKIEEGRGSEMDSLEAALITGELKPRDIEAAQFISEKDRAGMLAALEKHDAPTNEQHAKAWEILTTLREAREDPSMTQEQFRTLWNEARSSVLQRIAPQFQGDLKKELSYLSPAGRSTSGGFGGGYDKADLEAVGRDIAFRSRDAGIFGSIADEATPAEKEKAYRMAEDVRLEVKRYVARDPQADPEKVREFTDSLISSSRVKSNAKDFQSFVPGSAQRLRPAPAMPLLPPKSGTKDKSTSDPLQIPPGNAQASDALLPARQLETFIK